MKQQAIVVWCYALLIFVGGVMGQIIAHSWISLVASSLLAIFLLGCSAYMSKGYVAAYWSAAAIAFSLFLFFGYRFFLTYKLAPSGIMALLGGCIVAYLVFAKRET